MGRYPDRTGYTWIEFGRRAADGTEHYFTLGCGLRAVSGHTGLHSRWFFTTTQRIGRDLFLQNAQHTPLGRERLTETVGTAGRVYQKAEDYRRAVDDTLFGLGPRYGALLELLLRLRRPQLTRKLDENELPEALSDALPTLSAGIVEEVAKSFRSLQADKDTVRDFGAARDAVATFLREYAVYVRIAVRRRAAAAPPWSAARTPPTNTPSAPPAKLPIASKPPSPNSLYSRFSTPSSTPVSPVPRPPNARSPTALKCAPPRKSASPEKPHSRQIKRWLKPKRMNETPSPPLNKHCPDKTSPKKNPPDSSGNLSPSCTRHRSPRPPPILLSPTRSISPLKFQISDFRLPPKPASPTPSLNAAKASNS